MKSDSRDDEASETTEAVLVSEVIPATRERIFATWMSSEGHSAFTGEEAIIDPAIGGHHSTMGGYARGRTIALDPYRRIVQTWRAEDFPSECGDSTIEVTLEETVGGTLFTLLHSEIPQGLSDQFREAWIQYYLEPLKAYFTGRVQNGTHKADAKALVRQAGRAAGTVKKRAMKVGKPGGRKPGKAATKSNRAAHVAEKRVAGKRAATGGKGKSAGKAVAGRGKTTAVGARRGAAGAGKRVAGKAGAAKGSRVASSSKRGAAAKGPRRKSKSR